MTSIFTPSAKTPALAWVPTIRPSSTRNVRMMAHKKQKTNGRTEMRSQRATELSRVISNTHGKEGGERRDYLRSDITNRLSALTSAPRSTQGAPPPPAPPVDNGAGTAPPLTVSTVVPYQQWFRATRHPRLQPHLRLRLPRRRPFAVMVPLACACTRRRRPPPLLKAPEENQNPATPVQ